MDDVRWLTYEEMAAELGIERESARQLAKRKRWPRRPGNDGRARIGVPEETLVTRPVSRPDPAQEPGHTPADTPVQEPVQPPEHPPVHDPAVAVLTRHIERLEREMDAMRDRLASQETLPIQVAALNAALTELRADRDRWHAAATQRRSWWPWRRSA